MPEINNVKCFCPDCAEIAIKLLDEQKEELQVALKKRTEEIFEAFTHPKWCRIIGYEAHHIVGQNDLNKLKNEFLGEKDGKDNFKNS